MRKHHTHSVVLTMGLILALFAAPGWALEIVPDAQSLFSDNGSGEIRTLHDNRTVVHVGHAPQNDDAVTVFTELKTHATKPLADVAEIYLAGLGTDSHSGPDILSFVWVQGAASLFGPMWQLEVRSGEALTGGTVVKNVVLANVSPQAGHLYETHLSYDSDSGTVSIAVSNRTGGKRVYRGEQYVGSYSGQLYPMAGFRATEATAANQIAVNGPVSMSSVHTVPAFMPVGGEWVVGQPSATGRLVPGNRFDADDVITIHVPDVAVSHGVFHLVAEQPDGTMNPVAGPVQAPGLQLAAQKLPWGLSRLRLEFIDPDGTVLLRDHAEIVIGRATAKMGPLEVNAEKALLEGKLHMSTDGPEVPVVVNVNATLIRKQWDRGKKQYVKGHPTELSLPPIHGIISGDGSTISYEIPYPEPDHPGLWEVTVSPNIELGASVPLAAPKEVNRLFTTYTRAQNLDSKPFRIVMMPDTQIYAASYPDIFTRQAEWIAAYANELNIGAVLHVGDIVDNNDARQWKNADRSLHVLDGVVPYVLSVGNHDVRVFYSPQQSLFERNVPLFNEYFTIPNARANSNLAGTLIEGQLENSYSLFTLGGDDYLVLSFEWGPRDEALEWAYEVLAAHPNHRVIFITHAFTAPDGGWVTPDRYPVALPQPTDFVPEPSTVNSAADIWEKVINHHDNVFMILSGHMGGHSGIPHNVRVGKQGNTVVEIFANYQMEENGGNGWLPLLTFTPDDKIHVEAFSPYLCEHRFDFGQFWQSFTIDLGTGISLPRRTGLFATCGN